MKPGLSSFVSMTICCGSTTGGIGYYGREFTTKYRRNLYKVRHQGRHVPYAVLVQYSVIRRYFFCLRECLQAFRIWCICTLRAIPHPLLDSTQHPYLNISSIFNISQKPYKIEDTNTSIKSSDIQYEALTPRDNASPREEKLVLHKASYPQDKPNYCE